MLLVVTGRRQFTNCCSIIKKKKKKQTSEQKLLWSSLFLCSLRPDLRQIWKCRGKFKQLELASFALVLILCSLHVKTQVLYTLRLPLLPRTGGEASQWKPVKEEEQEEEVQVLPEKCRLASMKKTQKEEQEEGKEGLAMAGNQQVSPRSEESHTDPPPAATSQLKPCLPDKVTCVSFTLVFLVVAFPSCKSTLKEYHRWCS